MNANAYLDFLKNDLENELENLPLNLYNNMYFQQDGCPVHSSRLIKNYLYERFSTKWIGRNGPTEWPPRSPDLTPLDFYVWGRAKDLVYTEEIQNIDHLKDRIKHAFEIIKQEVTIHITTTEIRKRYLKCVEVQGDHFENL